jgi:cytochrome b561
LRNLRQADRPVHQLRPTRPRVCPLSHFRLYFFILAMPISGYMGNGSRVNYGIFQVKPFMDTSIANWIYNTFGIPFDIFHYGIARPFIIWVLVLLHVIAAIYHHTMLKDNVLKRMLPSKS